MEDSGPMRPSEWVLFFACGIVGSFLGVRGSARNRAKLGAAPSKRAQVAVMANLVAMLLLVALLFSLVASHTIAAWLAVCLGFVGLVAIIAVFLFLARPRNARSA
jgi:hypothetical protein